MITSILRSKKRSKISGTRVFLIAYLGLIQGPSFGQQQTAPMPLPAAPQAAPAAATTAAPPAVATTGNPFVDLQNANQQLIQIGTELERERDRQGKLTKELNSESSFGCWLNQPLESLVIKVVGSPIAEEKYLGNQDNPASNIGNGISFTYRLSDEVAMENNETQTPVFSAAGRLTFTVTPNKTVGSIRYLKIDKNGVTFISKAQQKSKSSFFSKKTEKWNEIFETGRYSISGITIEANGQVIYQRTGISHVFEQGNMSYVEDESTFKANAAYLALSSRTDCPGGDRAAATK